MQVRLQAFASACESTCRRLCKPLLKYVCKPLFTWACRPSGESLQALASEPASPCKYACKPLSPQPHCWLSESWVRFARFASACRQGLASLDVDFQNPCVRVASKLSFEGLQAFANKGLQAIILRGLARRLQGLALALARTCRRTCKSLQVRVARACNLLEMT